MLSIFILDSSIAFDWRPFLSSLRNTSPSTLTRYFVHFPISRQGNWLSLLIKRRGGWRWGVYLGKTIHCQEFEPKSTYCARCLSIFLTNEISHDTNNCLASSLCISGVRSYSHFTALAQHLASRMAEFVSRLSHGVCVCLVRNLNFPSLPNPSLLPFLPPRSSPWSYFRFLA